MSNSPQPFGACPVCAADLRGRAHVPTSGGQLTRAFMCPRCGDFFVPGPLSARLMNLRGPVRQRLADKLGAAREGPYVVTAEDVDAPT